MHSINAFVPLTIEPSPSSPSKNSGSATPLHLVTDWPGYFPNGPQIVKLLIDAGADPKVLTTSRGSETTGPGDETPLHYAASSDDADVADALIDGGAVPGKRTSFLGCAKWEPDPPTPTDLPEPRKHVDHG